jgi:hypothetical protein
VIKNTFLWITELDRVFGGLAFPGNQMERRKYRPEYWFFGPPFSAH